MQLPKGPAIQFRHVQYRRPNAKLGQYIRDAVKNSGDLPDANIGGEENPRYRYRGTPGEKLSGPFGSGSPRQPAGKFRIHTGAILSSVRAHLSVSASALE